MSDVFLRDKYRCTIKDNRAIVFIDNPNSFKKREIILMFVIENNTIRFAHAVETNNETDICYRDGEIESMHPGLVADIIEKFTKGHIYVE